MIRRSIALVTVLALLMLQGIAPTCQTSHHQEQASHDSHDSHSKTPVNTEGATADCVMMTSCGVVIPVSAPMNTFTATSLGDHPVLVPTLYTAPTLADRTPPPRIA